MKIFFALPLPACVVLLGSSLTACSTSEAPQPAAPAPSVTMERTFNEAGTSTYVGVSYTNTHVTSAATLSNTKLLVTFGAQAPGTGAVESIRLQLDRAKLPATSTGTFELMGLVNGGSSRGDVLTTYAYSPAGAASGSFYNSGFNAVRGTLALTSYDAKAQLLGGRYDCYLDEVEDPQETGTTLKFTNIHVAGTFTNLPVR